MWRWSIPVVALTGLPSALADSPTPPAFPNNLTLKQVSVVFRHGARAPLTEKYIDGVVWDDCQAYRKTVEVLLRSPSGSPCPPAPSNEAQVSVMLPGGCHKGQLTSKGQQQALEFGRFLRKRYIETHMLLPRQYQEGTVAGRSTHFSRTIATLRGVLTGMYPDNTRALPVTVSDEVDEILYTNVANCSVLKDLVLQAKKAETKASLQDMTTTASNVRDALGIPAHVPVNYVELYDALSCIKFHGKPLHSGVTDDLIDRINRQATKRILRVLAPPADGSDPPTLLRLGLGVLLQTIVGNMQRHVAAHDTTIMPLVVAMGVDVDTWPPYLSNLCFELWEGHPPGGPPTHYVRVLYNDSELRIPGVPLGVLCDLDTFTTQVLGPYLLSAHDRSRECTLKFGHDSSQPQPIDAQTGAAVQGI